MQFLKISKISYKVPSLTISLRFSGWLQNRSYRHLHLAHASSNFSRRTRSYSEHVDNSEAYQSIMAMHVPSAGFATMLKEGAKVLLKNYGWVTYLVSGSIIMAWRRQYLEISTPARNWHRLHAPHMDQMVRM